MQRITNRTLDELTVIRMENDWLSVDLVPGLGGKISGLYNKRINHEFLWRNHALKLGHLPLGSEYDPNFYGGIDELLPNDIPEALDGVEYPDHGELWTARLQHELAENKITVHGKLKLSGLLYRKSISLQKDAPLIYLDYKIKNESGANRHFLWKLHAALAIEPGDRLITAALKGKVVDPAYSRFKIAEEFRWPLIEKQDASVVPPDHGSMDFFYLYEIPVPEMQMISGNGKYLFSYRYDKDIFPYQWYFASYGGFLGHNTVILEPATGMPMSVNEAIALKQCRVLAPGEEINTRVSIYAGEKTNYVLNE